jgi:3'-phosphoadenosine 5'-phosphosulfate (PAPS) 3'-phosphatase
MTLHAADIQQINAWLVEAGALARAALATVTYNLKQDRTPVSTADYAVETWQSGCKTVSPTTAW